MSPEDLFNLEVLKLLLTLAWKDGEYEVHEKNMILGLGKSWSVPVEELAALTQQTDLGQKPLQIDWVLLKSRKDDVLTAARAMVLSDGKVKREETALLKEIEKALG
jgi:tellurite resistance protein